MTSIQWVLVGAVLRCVLLSYGSWQDRALDVKYTDIDYAVYSDAARFITEGRSPYDKQTYRYSPLVSWLLVPNAFTNDYWGKIVFCVFDLGVAWMMGIWERDRSRSRTAVILWLFNPFTFTISTRGNCDSITVFGVLALIRVMEEKRYFFAGLLWGLSIHWRLFPVIYAPIIFANITIPQHGSRTSRDRLINCVRRALSSETIHFCLGTFLTLMSLGSIFYWMYGMAYLENALLYHLRRIDPRHNFSFHFYPAYLTHWRQQGEMIPDSFASRMVEMIGLGKMSGLSLLVLIIAVGVRYGHDLPLAFSLSTILFVAFNKVCTAQYFVWYFGLLPRIIVRRRLRCQTDFLSSFLLWAVAVCHWLIWAYLLEFQGTPCFLQVWFASCLFFAAHINLMRGLLMTFG